MAIFVLCASAGEPSILGGSSRRRRRTMASFGQDGSPAAVGVIYVVVDGPEYRKKAQKVTQKAKYLLKYFTSLMGPMRKKTGQLGSNRSC